MRTFPDLVRLAAAMMARRDRGALSCLWELTYRCTARCAICSYWTRPTARRDELSLSEICRGLERIYGFGCRVVNFTGGEPTLRADLVEIVSHASHLGMWTSMVTNGFTLRRERLVRLREAGLDNCLISLDSLDPAVHDAQRRLPGSHARVVQALQWLAEAFMRGHRSGGAMCVLTRDNVDHMEELVRFARGLGVFIAFQPYHDKKTGATALNPPVDDGLVQRLLDLKRHYGNVLNSEGYVRGMRSFSRPAPAAKRQACRAGERYFSVDPTGGLHPCVDQPAVGHVLRDDLATLRSAEARRHVAACAGCWYSFRGEADTSLTLKGKWEKLRLCGTLLVANTLRRRQHPEARD